MIQPRIVVLFQKNARVKNIIITLLTERGFKFQHIHPCNIFHEAFTSQHPCHTCRPEVTPTILRSKTRRSITTIRNVSKIGIIIWIVHTTKETFCWVQVLFATYREFINHITQIEAFRIIQILSTTFQQCIFIGITIITGCYIEVMYIFKCKLIICNILLVKSISTNSSLISSTTIRSRLSHICITHFILTGIVDIQTVACRYCQTCDRSYLCKPVSVYYVTQIFSLIINQVTGRVSDWHERTREVCTLSVSIVIHFTSVVQ